jgi:hypothetical protein
VTFVLTIVRMVFFETCSLITASALMLSDDATISFALQKRRMGEEGGAQGGRRGVEERKRGRRNE